MLYHNVVDESSKEKGPTVPKLLTSKNEIMQAGGHDLLCALASTHALSLCPPLTSNTVQSEPELTGDPLDLKMFNFTDWVSVYLAINSISNRIGNYQLRHFYKSRLWLKSVSVKREFCSILWDVG